MRHAAYTRCNPIDSEIVPHRMRNKGQRTIDAFVYLRVLADTHLGFLTRRPNQLVNRQIFAVDNDCLICMRSRNRRGLSFIHFVGVLWHLDVVFLGLWPAAMQRAS